MVLKSARTPSSGTELGRIRLERTDIPVRIVNLVIGPEFGEALPRDLPVGPTSCPDTELMAGEHAM